MKHLKTFESSDKEYYWEIEQGEYVQKRDSTLVDISKEAINIANKNQIFGKISELSTINKKYSNYFLMRDIKSGITYGYIVELEDEWFIVSDIITNSHLNKFYLCDQLEGLDKCLHNIYGSTNFSKWI